MGLLRVATIPLLVVLVVLPSIEAALGAIQSAIVTASVAGAALLLTRLPDVVEFSLWGVKAKMEKAVREAEVTIEQLREMALAFAEASLSDLAAGGSIPSHVAIAHKFKIRGQIVASLDRLGADPADVVRVQRHWTRTHCGLLAVEIASAILRLENYRVGLALESLPTDDVLGVTPPKVFRDIAESRGYTDAGLSTLLDEYERLFTTGSMHDRGMLGHLTDAQLPPDIPDHSVGSV